MFEIINENEQEILLKNRKNIINFIESDIILRKFTTEREKKDRMKQTMNAYIHVLKHLPKVHKKSKIIIIMNGFNVLNIRPVVAVGANSQTSLMQKYICTQVFYMIVYCMKIIRIPNVCYNNAKLQHRLMDFESDNRIYIDGYDFVIFHNNIPQLLEKHGLRYLGDSFGFINNFV